MPDDSTERARALLQDPSGRPTPAYSSYLQQQQNHQAARQSYDDAFAAAQRDPVALQAWPVVGRSYQRAVDAAYDRWVALGHKTEVERALAVLAAPAVEAPAPPATPSSSCD